MSATIRRDAAHDGGSLHARAKEEHIPDSQKRSLLPNVALVPNWFANEHRATLGCREIP